MHASSWCSEGHLNALPLARVAGFVKQSITMKINRVVSDWHGLTNQVISAESLGSIKGLDKLMDEHDIMYKEVVGVFHTETATCTVGLLAAILSFLCFKGRQTCISVSRCYVDQNKLHTAQENYETRAVQHLLHHRSQETPTPELAPHTP